MVRGARYRVNTNTEQLRDHIDGAVEACEQLNLAERNRLPRWIRQLVVELARYLDVDLTTPKTPAEAHNALMDLAERLQHARQRGLPP
jgi:hypothetical protein